MRFNISFISIVIFFFFYTETFAQNGEVNVLKISIEAVPAYVVFDKNSGRSGVEQIDVLFKQVLEMNPNDELKETSVMDDELGFKHIEYQQYFKGIKVEHGRYKVHVRQGKIESANGEFYKVVIPRVAPQFTSEEAMAKLQNHLGASTYMWENQENAHDIGYSKPTGELVIYPILNGLKNTLEYHLTYKFDIYTAEPLDRAYYFINATNGEVVGIEQLMCSSNAETRYSGDREIETEETDDGYRLYDATRGGGIHTLDKNRTIVYWDPVTMMIVGLGYMTTEFLDQDDDWTAAEHANAEQEQVGLDVHWGVEMSYDYFSEVHGRNSFDGNGAEIKSYVNANFCLCPSNNAAWTGSEMIFGYGDSTNYYAWTTLDICAHELGHGVCQYSANLVYSYESGALNESLSDIWGACVEEYAAPEKEQWLLGEEMTLSQYALRDMSNPNALELPDTYLGNFWLTGPSDNGGVHFNSSVLNHWFYLLSDGSQNTDEVNDNGDVFHVDGIGIDSAAKIAYRMETVYLTSNSQYEDARDFGIQSAIDLFGECSDAHKATQNAFYAVGLGEEYCKPRSDEQDIWIKRVRSVNNGSIVYNNFSGASSYSDYTSDCITSFNNQTQTISFLVNKNNQYMAVWFDTNNDGQFENNSPELIFNNQIPGKHQIFRVIDITGLMANETGLLRVIVSSKPIFNPCDDIENGETEDYLICSDDFCVTQIPTNLQVENGVLVWDEIPGVWGYEITNDNSSDGPIPQCNCEIPFEFANVVVEENFWEVPEEIQSGCFLWAVRAICGEGAYSEYSNYACFNGSDFQDNSDMYESQDYGFNQEINFTEVAKIAVFDIAGRLIYSGTPIDLRNEKQFYNGLLIIQYLDKDGNHLFTEKRVVFH